MNLQDIQTIKEVRFRRTIIPPDASSLHFTLAVSSAASKSLVVASVHTRVPLVSSGFFCQLLTTKIKIVCYTTIPHAELRTAVMSASLSHSVQHYLHLQVPNVIYTNDSTIVVHDKHSLETAIQNSVIEIQRLSHVKQ